MRGGCIEKISRRRPPLGSSECESDDACEPGPLECHVKLKFALEKLHSVGIAGRVRDSPSGDDAGGRSAVRGGLEGPEVRRESEHRSGRRR